MPTYEYRCAACGHHFERFQKMSEEAGADCPECGAVAERKMSGGAGLLFKGSGFYITDYRNPSYRKAAESDSGGGGKEAGAGGAKESGGTKEPGGAKESGGGGGSASAGEKAAARAAETKKKADS
jgi:putative FmdB family regulatory protein